MAEIKKATLPRLLKRATSGGWPDRKTMAHPSLMARVMRDPFGVWCDYHAPREERFFEKTGYEELIGQMAQQHRSDWLDTHYPDAALIQASKGNEALEQTLKFMLEGVPAIRRPNLWAISKGLFGQTDLIIRDDSHSSLLGPYHYRIIEVKRAKKMRVTYSLQAALFNRILGYVMGFLPPYFEIVLNSGTEKVFHASVKSRLESVLKTWKKIRDGKKKIRPNVYDGAWSPWRAFGNKILEEKKDLTLLPDVHPTTREMIETNLKIKSIDDLKKPPLESLTDLLGEKMGESVFYSARAYLSGKPVMKEGAPFLLPSADRHLFFDFEFSDDMNPNEKPHVFLIGVYDASQKSFESFLGNGARDEEKIFKEFFDFVGNPDKVKLFHWGDHEPQQLKRVANSYPHLKETVEKGILSLVDLLKFIRGSVFLPVPTYSLKRVAPALGFEWRQEDVGAMESMLFYWDSLKNGDQGPLKKVLDYNEDDCKAMWHVAQSLEETFNNRY